MPKGFAQSQSQLTGANKPQIESFAGADMTSSGALADADRHFTQKAQEAKT